MATLANGDVVVTTSRTPFLDAARRLLELGYPADAVIAMRHAGSVVDSLRATIGNAARLTVKEKAAGSVPRFARWEPYRSSPVSPPIAPEYGTVVGRAPHSRSPRSDHPWQAEPYREALANRFRNAVDLTDSFSRSGLARAGTGAKLGDVVASLAYKSTAREKNFQRIAIVDDTFTRGVTVAATVIHLRQHGLPEECHIVVACPLWLDTVKPAASLA
jgi:hypothetical protein